MSAGHTHWAGMGSCARCEPGRKDLKAVLKEASDTPLTSDFGGRERYNQGADRGEVGAPPRPLDTPTTSVQEVPGMTRAQDTKAV